MKNSEKNLKIVEVESVIYNAVNYAIVTLSNGLKGIGASSCWAYPSATDAVLRTFREYLIGKKPFEIEHHWQYLYRMGPFRGSILSGAISAIDIAIWDIVAKAVGRPLYQVLGGYTDEVRAYIAGGYYEDGKGLSELQEEMLGYVEQGANAVKMKIGAVPLREDEIRVRAVREAIGPEIDLLVDANNAYVHADAVRMGRILEEYDAFWFEEPVSPDNMRGSALTARLSTVPVAAGENEYTSWGFRELFETGAVDIVNPDAMVLGGITEYRRVAALAAAYEIPIAPHGLQEIHIHLLAAFPMPLILEYYNSNVAGLNDVMFHEKLELTDQGTVKLPSGPGLGLTINWDALAEYKVE